MRKKKEAEFSQCPGLHAVYIRPNRTTPEKTDSPWWCRQDRLVTCGAHRRVSWTTRFGMFESRLLRRCEKTPEPDRLGLRVRSISIKDSRRNTGPLHPRDTLFVTSRIRVCKQCGCCYYAGGGGPKAAERDLSLSLSRLSLVRPAAFAFESRPRSGENLEEVGAQRHRHDGGSHVSDGSIDQPAR